MFPIANVGNVYLFPGVPTIMERSFPLFKVIHSYMICADSQKSSVDNCENNVFSYSSVLKTYVANSHTHHSCFWKQGKLSGSCLSEHYEYGSIQFSDTLNDKWILLHFLDKIK